MDEYLLDRETLGQFIDELMKQRTLPVESAEDLTKYREEQMSALDNHITNAIFGKMNNDQVASLSRLLDQEKENPEVFKNFFSEQRIDINQIVTDAIKSFGMNYLAGGQNE